MRVCFAGGCGHASTAHISDIEVCGVWFTGQETPEQRKALFFDESARVYSSFESMIDCCNADVAVIDGFYGDHAGMAVYALERGVNVYCEKPVALSLEQLEKVKLAHERSNARICPMLTSRYDSWFYTLYNEVRAGRIGEVRLINAQKSYKFGNRPDFYKHAEQFGNTFMWVGIHPVDLILWLTNSRIDESEYYPSATNKNGFGSLDDCAVAILKTANGVLATVTVDYLRDAKACSHGDDRIRVVGDRGILEVANEELTLYSDGVAVKLPLASPPDIFTDFINSIKNHTVCIADDESAFSSAEAVIKITGGI